MATAYTSNNEKKDIIPILNNVLTKYEGKEYHTYYDPADKLGNITIGIGTLLYKDGAITKNGKELMRLLGETNEASFRKLVKPNANKTRIIPVEKENLIIELFSFALNDTLLEVKKQISNWESLPYKAQVVAINIAYQWGPNGAKGTFNAINRKDYAAAVDRFFENSLIYDHIKNKKTGISVERQYWNGKILLQCAEEAI